MSSREVWQLIAHLPNSVGRSIFVEFSKELEKAAKFSSKLQEFVREMPQDESPFSGALMGWDEAKVEQSLDQMADNILAALQKHYGNINVKREEVKQCLKDLDQTNKGM